MSLTKKENVKKKYLLYYCICFAVKWIEAYTSTQCSVKNAK